MTDLFLLINSESTCVFSLQAGEQHRGKKKTEKLIYDYKSKLTVTPTQPKVKDRRLTQRVGNDAAWHNESDISTRAGRARPTETRIRWLISSWEVLSSTEHQTRGNKFKEQPLVSELASPVAHKAGKTVGNSTRLSSLFLGTSTETLAIKMIVLPTSSPIKSLKNSRL